MHEFQNEYETLAHAETVLTDTDVLMQLQKTDPEMADHLIEITMMLVIDLGWGGEMAARYALDWAADNYFGYEYVDKPMTAYE